MEGVKRLVRKTTRYYLDETEKLRRGVTRHNIEQTIDKFFLGQTHPCLDSNVIIPGWVTKLFITTTILLAISTIIEILIRNVLFVVLQKVFFYSTPMGWPLMIFNFIILSILSAIIKAGPKNSYRKINEELYFVGSWWVRLLFPVQWIPMCVCDILFMVIFLFAALNTTDYNKRALFHCATIFHSMHLAFSIVLGAIGYLYLYNVTKGLAIICFFFLVVRYIAVKRMQMSVFSLHKPRTVKITWPEFIPFDKNLVKIRNYQNGKVTSKSIGIENAKITYENGTVVTLTCTCSVIPRHLKISYDNIPMKHDWICEFCGENDPEYELSCGHSACVGCLGKRIRMSLEKYTVPICGLLGDNCRSRILETDVTSICSALNNVQLLEQVKTFVTNLKTKPCPNVKCSHRFDPNSRPSTKQGRCPACHTAFCWNCFERFHYETSCEDIPKIQNMWNHLALYTFPQKNHTKSLMVKQIEMIREEIRERMKEYQSDEQWKVYNTRLCPNCGRCIQRTDGCNSMVCGRDSDGGNYQNGCQSSFQWDSAPRYVADSTASHLSTQLNRLQSAGNRGVACNSCASQIHGPLLQCIYCSSHYSCLACSCTRSDSHCFNLV